jgi:signal transduction histidine kinase
VLDQNHNDVPFAAVYLVAPDGQSARVVARSGADQSPAELADTIALDSGPFLQAIRSGEPQTLDLARAAGDAGKVLVLPISPQAAPQPVAFLVAGTSPRLMLDAAYRDFLNLVASQIGTSIAGARMLEEIEGRAEELARLDRAKTIFFSNVSHEFRTPLTLMLGPTEEAMASPERTLRGNDLETVYRNQQRLLKLVNTLLEFSRIEAGRVEARFVPTDLSALTADLASAFRSAMTRAGLELVVQCPPLNEPVYVDPEMWEKIVLNLLSNALKFTFEGSVAVSVAATDGGVELRVRDTGTGIAPDDLSRIFERFQRVERAAARTHEGSGIGLALVQELVTIHGGTICATSELGRGTELIVRLPLGLSHLPPERVVTGTANERTKPATAAAVPFVAEALRWLPEGATEDDAATEDGDGAAVPNSAARVLVADDNADMRDYLKRLLSVRYRVQAVSAGDEALAIALEQRPDVVLSDVMMPGLDGFQLIAALRSREQTRTVPVILLSARAGEEARVGGLQAGADDYLVKPFSARELVARIDAQLVRAKLRSLEEAQALQLADVFEHAPVGVAIVRDREHVFQFANERYLELVGGRPLLGKSIREALPELAGQGIYELMDEVYDSGKPRLGRSARVLIQRRRELPEETFFDFTYQPRLDELGRVKGITVVAVDVTALTVARRQAEAANRAKDEFLAMLGHELRNPLAPILTALQLMRLRGVSGADRERNVIERQVKHLMTLVDDLLDVSRIARGKVQLKRERLDFADVVARAIEMTSPAIDDRRHVLEVDVPRGLIVDADAARLAQVLANLLTNAAKYTDPGGRIRISAEAVDGQLRVRIVDNGRGIDPAILPSVFELFSQERQEIDRSQGGLGLGLAIVKSLVEAHQGSVRAYSEGKGKGAQLTVEIPLARVSGDGALAVADDAEKDQVRPGLRILIVDDNTDAAELLGESLRELGHTARIAYDGPGALEVARRFLPEVALVDLGLPVMDGFEVARALKSMSETQNVILAAVTGYGQQHDRERTREAGFEEHLVKPVDLDRLENWLRERYRKVHPDGRASTE